MFYNMSHPAWVRGLKPSKQAIIAIAIKSHPAWVRGLKQRINKFCIFLSVVAPCVGAWIETGIDGTNKYTLESRTLRGCVD